MLKLKQSNQNSPGVMTNSSGNYAMALAYASSKAGLPCSMVVPSTCSLMKQDIIKGYGGQIFFSEPTAESRYVSDNGKSGNTCTAKDVQLDVET